VQTSGLVDQLLDIHGNGYGFSDASRARTGLGGFCDARGFVQFGMNLSQHDLDCWFDRGTVHGGLPLRPPHTLRTHGKSSRS
jgi:hypothetical protein